MVLRRGPRATTRRARITVPGIGARITEVLPHVEHVRTDNAPSCRMPGASQARCRRDGHGACIRERISNFAIFGPTRDQPLMRCSPRGAPALPAGKPRPHNRHQLRRRCLTTLAHQRCAMSLAVGLSLCGAAACRGRGSKACAQARTGSSREATVHTRRPGYAALSSP